MTSEAYWDAIFAGHQAENLRYDLWLEPYAEMLQQRSGRPILDLGCGAGNNTLYAAERGWPVIACDRSGEALKRVNERLPGVPTVRLDLRERLPFDDGIASAVIADLCLHYFSWAETVCMVDDIRRVLSTDGLLLCRVNSTRDQEYGAGQGTEVEPHYYAWEGQLKRFFDRAQVDRLFRGWALLNAEEQVMTRYAKEKQVWMIAAAKR
ncbi:class I SAM-dependent methyltransferase [Paenibacillus sp.]|uniref:class I SAM-dependent methyltransferase n=1 Tax=Paenibacillus sp. TaxID=58172 RepID=UPI003563477F